MATAATGVVAAWLLLVAFPGSRRINVGIGMIAGAGGLVLALRHHRPRRRALWLLVLGWALAVALATLASPWTGPNRVYYGPGERFVILPFTAVLPIVGAIVILPYLRSALTWHRLLPVVAVVALVPVASLAALADTQLSARRTAGLMVIMYVLGWIVTAPMVRHLGRVTDCWLYGALVGFPVAAILAVLEVQGAIPMALYVTMGVVVVGAWHPSMASTGAPLSDTAATDARHAPFTWTLVTATVFLVVYWSFVNDNPAALLGAVASGLLTIGDVVWSLSTGRSSTGEFRLRIDLGGAIIRHEFVPAYQPIVGSGGTELGAIVWSRWRHRRLGVLGASEWWDVARRGEFTVAIEASILATVRSRLDDEDLGVVVVTLDDPERHRDALTDLAHRCALVVRCQRGFDAVRSTGSRLATSIELAGIADPDIIVIPSTVVAWAQTVRGHETISGIVATAARLNALTLAEGTETEAARRVLMALGVDLVCGFGVGRPVLSRPAPRSTR
jgi:hypothetical protein